CRGRLDGGGDGAGGDCCVRIPVVSRPRAAGGVRGAAVRAWAGRSSSLHRGRVGEGCVASPAASALHSAPMPCASGVSYAVRAAGRAVRSRGGRPHKIEVAGVALLVVGAYLSAVKD